MPLSDELAKLQDLHQHGALTDDEFARAKSRLLDGSGAQAHRSSSAQAAINAVRRSRTDRWIAGLCGGIARATGLESWVCRLVFAALFFVGGLGLVTYVLLWVFVPSE